MPEPPISAKPDPYIHGRAPTETARLEAQAAFIGATLLDRVEVPTDPDRVLDLGCGVGAMTRRLLEKGAAHPVGIDRAPVQVAEARRLTARGAASFAVAEGGALPFRDGAFDLVFSSWFFEHVPDPPAILREAHRVLAPGGSLWAAEVESASFLAFPSSAELDRTWRAFCDQQLAFRGDPFIGRRMYGLLAEAGFDHADAWPVTLHVHNGRPDDMRAAIDEFVGILESAREAMVGSGRIDAATCERGIADLAALPRNPAASFTYTFMRCRAVKDRRGGRSGPRSGPSSPRKAA